MNGFDFIIQLISALMEVVGFVLIIEGLAAIYYTRYYLNNLEECKRTMIEIDKERGISREYNDEKLIEAVKVTRNGQIFKGVLGIILLIGGFVALFVI